MMRGIGIIGAGSLALAAAVVAAFGCSKASHADTGATNQAAVPATPVNGVVAVTVDDKGFTPSQVVTVKGQPLELDFTRTSDATCATKVVFPDLKIERDLPLNTKVAIPVPTGEARTLGFQCGMGMYKSAVVVQ